MNNTDFMKHIAELVKSGNTDDIDGAVLDNILEEHDLPKYRNDQQSVITKYTILLKGADACSALNKLPGIVMQASDVEDCSERVKVEKLNREALLSEVIYFMADNYYNGNEMASNDVYDMMVAELNAINPNNPLSKNGLAAADNTGRPKIPHKLITGTQEKCKDMVEFAKWHSDRKQYTGKYMLNAKVDGAGVELQYVNGMLKIAISRGDGNTGEDITKSAMNWNNLPNGFETVCLPNGTVFNGSIRGEYLVKESIFREKYAGEMRNARNASAGIAKRLDASGSEDLSFIAYDVLNDDSSLNFETESAKMDWLMKAGFEVPEWSVVSTIEEVEAFRDNIKKMRQNEIDYGCDGVVVKQETIDYEDLKRLTPTTQCAIKFPLDTAITELLNIEWGISGTYLSPVGIVAPVELNETTVQRASLSNLSKMMEMGIEIGKKVRIQKSGEIIPKIVEVVN